MPSTEANQMRRRVVISGVGCINPMGHDVETMWQALQEGQSGVAETTIFDASAFRRGFPPK